MADEDLRARLRRRTTPGQTPAWARTTRPAGTHPSVTAGRGLLTEIANLIDRHAANYAEIHMCPDGTVEVQFDDESGVSDRYSLNPTGPVITRLTAEPRAAWADINALTVDELRAVTDQLAVGQQAKITRMDDPDVHLVEINDLRLILNMQGGIRPA